MILSPIPIYGYHQTTGPVIAAFIPILSNPHEASANTSVPPNDFPPKWGSNQKESYSSAPALATAHVTDSAFSALRALSWSESVKYILIINYI